MWDITQDIIASYEARVAAVGRIMEDTHQMLEDFREEREQLHNGLKEALANRESLRKKDFDAMMDGALLAQKAREKEVKERLRGFLDEQKRMASELREVMAQSQAKRAQGERLRLDDFKAVFSKIKNEQEEREREVREILDGFRREQEEMAAQMRGLLHKGTSLRIKEVKAMVRDFRVRQDRRREEVKQMGAAWRELTPTMGKKRTSRVVTSAAESG